MQDFKPKAPLNISSVANLLEKNAQKFGEKKALITVDPHSQDSQTVSHQELKKLVYQTAAFLNKIGVKKGDCYAILMPNTAEVLILELAGALIGASTVPLDSKRDTLDRKLFKLKETNSKALFMSSKDSDEAEVSQIKKDRPDIKIINWSNFSEYLSLLPKDKIKPINSLTSHYVILYTSGTTNMPKGVPLTVEACFLNAMGIAKWQQFKSSDIFNLVLPLHHINSTIFALSMLLVGGTVVLNTTYSASKFWQIIAQYKCTNTSIVPTILHDLLVRKEEFFSNPPDISTLKRICIGSAPVLPEETLKFYETFGIRVTQGYGQTETALRVTGVPINLDEASYLQMVKTNSIGVELANCLVEIMDKENEPKKENQEGEICIFGPTLGKGYLNDLEATNMSFIDNWFHSGDLGYWKNLQLRLENGQKLSHKFFFIVGRIKEIIIKGGINISPSAIEDALLKAFPQISEVSVVGFADIRIGEEIAAVVVLKDGVERQEFEKKMLDYEFLPGLSVYEIPKKVFFFDELPKTSTGKIQRVEAKNRVAKLIEAEEKKHYYVRVVREEEKEILNEVTKINNQRFEGLPASVEQFKKRAKNGILLGVFEENEGILGSLSSILLKLDDLKNFKTWDEATSGGTLENNNPNGDTLVCVAISVKSSKEPTSFANPKIDELKLSKLAKEHIQDYVNSDKDHVLNFHKKPKGGLDGAKVWKILESGRSEDREAVGYNVLMKYPDITKGTKLNHTHNASPSVRLIEQALILAKEKGLIHVLAFSRPIGFRKYLASLANKL